MLAPRPSSGERFWRAVAFASLVLAAVLLGQDMLRDYVLGAREPRVAIPRGDLAPVERHANVVFTSVAPSVVSVFAMHEASRSQPAGTGAGSGVIWDRAGHIVTNAHVVAGATQIGVVLDDGRTLAARVVGRAASTDIAVLALPTAPQRSSADRRGNLGRSRGWPDGLCHRQPVRPVAHAHHRNHQRSRPPAAYGGRPRSGWGHPDRRGDQSRQLGRTARR